jgi:hypothetical protein
MELQRPADQTHAWGQRNIPLNPIDDSVAARTTPPGAPPTTRVDAPRAATLKREQG